jgi:serine/threonine-protein kinase
MKLRDLLKAVPAFLAEQDEPAATIPPSPTGVLKGLGITIEESYLDSPSAALPAVSPTLHIEDRREHEVDATLSDSPIAVETRPRRLPGPTPKPPETQLGRYELGQELGRGGMGRVVEAADSEIGRTVAIKVLLDPHRVSDETLARFVAEARITGQLQHPNIVPVYEMGVTGRGQFYFVMKRVDGRSLLDVLRDLRKGVPEVAAEWTRHRLLTAFVQVCNAVAYAHDRNLIHRDLKPDNIMVGKFGEVLVMDWGIARVMGPSADAGAPPPRPTFDSRVEPPEPTAEHAAPVHPAVEVRTQAGATFGTPGYMSPEQSRGKMDELDGRSDVWSLGAILFQLLTFSRAFGHRDPLKLMRIAATAPTPDPRERGRYVPDEIADTCMKAMAKKPVDRQGTADALGKAVRSFLDGSLAKEKAAGHLGEAQRAWTRYLDQQTSAQDLLRREAALEATTAAWAPLGDKVNLFAVRMRRAAEEPMLMEAFGDLVAASEQALALDPQNAEARELLARAFWARFQEAEEDGDAASMRFYRARMLAFDDGRHEGALLEGGRITLHTDPPGAAAYAARIDRREVTWNAGEEEYLGLTPLEGLPLPVGSYRIRLVHGGKRDTVYPARIRRGGHWTSGDRPIPLFADATIGEDFVYVPRGPAVFGGDPGGGHAKGLRAVDGFFASVHPVTMAEYAVYLTSLHRQNSELAWKRVPRQESGFRTSGGQYWPRPPDGAAYYLPDQDRDGDVWDATWPVFSISWEDAMAYTAWAGGIDGTPYALPTEEEWEKVTRGVDGRLHPWGDAFDPALCKMRDSQPGRPFPEAIGAFTTDISIYGVEGLGGSAREWCADTEYNGDPERRPVRGGGWDSGAAQARATHRTGFHQWRVVSDVGFRLVKPLPR